MSAFLGGGQRIAGKLYPFTAVYAIVIGIDSRICRAFQGQLHRTRNPFAAVIDYKALGSIGCGNIGRTVHCTRLGIAAEIRIQRRLAVRVIRPPSGVCIGIGIVETILDFVHARNALVRSGNRQFNLFLEEFPVCKAVQKSCKTARILLRQFNGIYSRRKLIDVFHGNGLHIEEPVVRSDAHRVCTIFVYGEALIIFGNVRTVQRCRSNPRSTEHQVVYRHGVGLVGDACHALRQCKARCDVVAPYGRARRRLAFHIYGIHRFKDIGVLRIFGNGLSSHSRASSRLYTRLYPQSRQAYRIRLRGRSPKRKPLRAYKKP